jgi:hypothetical protein
MNVARQVSICMEHKVHLYGPSTPSIYLDGPLPLSIHPGSISMELKIHPRGPGIYPYGPDIHPNGT